MQLKKSTKRNPALQAGSSLAAATCALLGPGAPTTVSAQELAPWDVDAAMLIYAEGDGRVRDASFNLIGIKELKEDSLLSLSLAYDSLTNIATFTYAPGALPDGNYRATLLAAGITNAGGVPMATNHVFNFVFLRGDANNDGTVNLTDFNILAGNFGQSNRTYSQGDFDYDNAVTLADFNILAGSYGDGPGATLADGDLTGDGFINVSDFNTLAGDYGCAP